MTGSANDLGSFRLKRVLVPLARELAVFIFFLGLSAQATRPLLRDLRNQSLSGGDPLVDLWTVDWLTKHFFEPGRIFHGNIFHPAPHAVLYSDLSMGTAVLLLPFRALLLDPVPLYNLGVLLSLSFGGWSFHALTRYVTGSRSAGLLSGVLAAFSSHQLSHLYHLNLLSIGWLALFLLGLHRAVRKPGPGSAILAGISFSLSAQSSGYYGVAAVLLALVFAATHWREVRPPRTLAWLAAAGTLAAALTLPYLLAYTELGLSRPLGMSVQMAFRPLRDLGSYSYLHRTWLGSEGERLFPGILTLVMAAIAVGRRRAESGFYAVATIVLLLVSFGPQLEIGSLSLTLPYQWLASIPPFNGMRHPYTFAAVATFTLAVLAGLGWASLRVSRRAWAGAAVVLIAIAETVAPAPSLRPVLPGLPPAYTLLQERPPGPILELPVFAEETLLWAARHGQPVLNGQGSAFVPVDTLRLARFIDNHWINSVPADVDTSKPTPFLLRRFPVRYVIVPVGRTQGLGLLAQAFDRSRLFVFLAEVSDGDRIYEVRRDVPVPDSSEEREEP